MKRLLGLTLSCLAVWLVALAGDAAAQERTAARLSCRTEAGPGRVSCELEVEVGSKLQLAWADGLVVRSPEFAGPLRSRVGISQASAKTPTRVRLPIALGATAVGQGSLEVVARWVVCSPGNGCHSGTSSTKAAVRVGSVAEP